MKKTKALVTGGAGFIGSHVVDALIEKGYEVVVVDNLSTGKKENLNSKAKFYNLDILSQKLVGIFKKEKPEYVFHLAAQINVLKSIVKPLEDATINILGSINVLENCREYKVKKIIFSSSGGAIFGDANIMPTPDTMSAKPGSPYGIDKLTVDNYLNFYYKIYGLKYISLRYANVYGPRQNAFGEAGVIAIFVDQLTKGKDLIINGDGRQTRDFVYVTDVVNANLLALKSPKVGIYNIGTGIETSINDLVKILITNIRVTGKSIKIIHKPAKEGEVRRSCLSSKQIYKDLGWEPKYDIVKVFKHFEV